MRYSLNLVNLERACLESQLVSTEKAAILSSSSPLSRLSLPPFVSYPKKRREQSLSKEVTNTIPVQDLYHFLLPTFSDAFAFSAALFSTSFTNRGFTSFFKKVRFAEWLPPIASELSSGDNGTEFRVLVNSTEKESDGIVSNDPPAE